MGTCNFVSQEHFPLYIHEDDMFSLWACPDCSCDEFGYIEDYVILDYNHDSDSWECPECGCSTSFPYADLCFDCGYDSGYAELFYDDVRDACERASEELEFWTIDIISGYYSGAQLVAFLSGCNNHYRRYYAEQPEDYLYDDSDIADANAEIDKVRNALASIAWEFDFKEMRCIGVFSNGEAVYEYAS